MKVYISCDIEGIAGITHWDEATKTHPTYPEFREQMTREAIAACNGAIAAGATEILLKDAHDSGRNILTADLPESVRIIRGWSGHPLSMVQELDSSFDAVMLIGYHSKAGAEGNPLAHTMTGRVSHITLNGVVASEFLLHSYAAAMHNVPVVLVSGDKGLGEDVKALNPNISTVATSEGIGRSTVSIAPQKAVRVIEATAEEALRGNRAACRLTLPTAFKLEIAFNNPTDAYATSWYPGARHLGNRTVGFETSDYFEVLRALKFILKV
ncbi:M55 family metallopeptidase [Dongia soli]|uniref:M55 family metallopeptidase n=1 Tax=Dongia soli TaxID=600628 RepID=A0ABU5E586_9PROT|nr:M55 family metallopeptidase [Dongia soli]MDY0881430.1 M55 family metallopeptidase [Dongia soli]